MTVTVTVTMSATETVTATVTVIVIVTVTVTVTVTATVTVTVVVQGDFQRENQVMRIAFIEQSVVCFQESSAEWQTRNFSFRLLALVNDHGK